MKTKSIKITGINIDKLIKKFPKLKDLEQLDDASIKFILKVIHNRLQKGKDKQKFQSRISLSGKYKSIRNLIETLLNNNSKTTLIEAIKIIEAEYPNSAFLRDAYRQWAYYKSMILKSGQWQTVTPKDPKELATMQHFLSKKKI